MSEKTKEKSNITLQMIDDSFHKVKKGEVVKGKIVSIKDNEVLVDIGYKSEGSISLNEFEKKPELFSDVNVYVGSIENRYGKVLLSKRIADQQQNFLDLVKCFEENISIFGEVKKLVNGGYFVDINGCKAFLPGSLVDVKPVKDYEQFVGKSFDMKIVNLDKKKRNIIVSRKKYLMDKNQKKRNEILKKIEVDMELDGIVKTITNYGAFIDLGGIDGLVHISDMSWGDVKNPADMLNVDDRVRVKVIAYDTESGRISLGIKQLVPHPWENIDKKYSVGDNVSGIVVNLENYGAFIELEPGIKGLIHKSELSWTKKIYHPKQILDVGQKVNSIILSLSKEEKKISLGLKQMTLNPWLGIENKFEIGEVIERKIKSITSFGLFLELSDDIDGLVHITDISWTKRIDDPQQMFKVGDKIKVVILEIDKSLHKVSFGIKQLTENPWDKMEEILPIDFEVEAKIVKMVERKGMVVNFQKDEYSFEGFIPISFFDFDNSSELTSQYNEGDIKKFKIHEINKSNFKIILKLAE